MTTLSETLSAPFIVSNIPRGTAKVLVAVGHDDPAVEDVGDTLPYPDVYLFASGGLTLEQAVTFGTDRKPLRMRIVGNEDVVLYGYAFSMTYVVLENKGFGIVFIPKISSPNEVVMPLEIRSDTETYSVEIEGFGDNDVDLLVKYALSRGFTELQL